MNISFKNINWKKTGIISLSVIFGLYILFLALPFVISPFVNSYSEQIEQIIKTSVGIEANIDGFGVTSSPKLAVGVKIKKISLKLPEVESPFFEGDNLKGDLRLLPLIVKKVQFGTISAKSVYGSLNIQKDGEFEIADYFSAQEDTEQEPMTALPFGLKFSNHLPDIKIHDYKISLVDISDKKDYCINGKNLSITDFILDKKVKVSTAGEIVFDGRKVSEYDIKINNNIMPKLQLDDLIFPKKVNVEENQTVTEKTSQSPVKFNITDIFETINNNKLTANMKINAKTSGTFSNPEQRGSFILDGVSIAVDGKQLPESYAKMIFKGKKTDIDSIFYTSTDKKEQTQIIGTIKSGKKPFMDLTFRSNAKFANLINLFDSIAQSVGINDLKTITATGAIDADFNINSDFKKVLSSGYLKIEPSSVKHGGYNISVDNINADIDFMNNNVNIKNAGFSVMGHPLTLKGTVSSDAVADLKLVADRLSLKGLLLVSGQVGLLKENDLNSGTLSLNTILKGPLTEIKPDVTVVLEKIDIFNKAAKAKVLLDEALIKLLINGQALSGDIGINSLALKLDGAGISVPKAKVTMDTKDINIANTYVLINNSKVDVKGSVKDYTTDKLSMNISANGSLAGKDVAVFIPAEMRSMFPYAGAMPLNLKATGNAKEQNIIFDLIADANNYVKILDISALKGKQTKIHSQINIAGDVMKFVNSGIFAGNNSLASFSGEVTNLSNPDMNINVSVPKDISFPVPGLGNSNITANGNVNVSGHLDKPKIKGKVYASDVSVKDMNFTLSNLVANLGGDGISGHATAEKMKFNGIVATNIASKFSLIDFTDFYLNDLSADAFSGKVNGKISYNLPHFAFILDMTGKGLNSMDAVHGAVGIQKALTGTMGFNAKLNSKGVTDIEIIKQMKGNIDFNVDNGRFVSIGKFENLVMAQNITTNSILKSAISAFTTAYALQETDRFKTITGLLTLSDGNANITGLKVSGPLMSYYIKGVYNILQNSANLVILGRLDSKIISYLGPLGQLSAEKLLSYIPKFGTATAEFLNKLTQNPNGERIDLIPELSSGSKSYKDFKVIFNGSVEKSTSVKVFKWLSVCDTTKMDLKQEMQNSVQAAKDNVTGQINTAKQTVENVKNNVTNILNTQKQNIENDKKTINQAKQDIKNIKQNAVQSAANLNNLLKNAALNANKKMENSATTEVKTETKQETKTESETPKAQETTATDSSDSDPQ